MPTGASIDELLAHAGWARRLARRLCRDGASADDLLQQAWLRALELPPRSRSAAPGWFAAVIANLARDRGRSDTRRARRERVVARTVVVDGADVDGADVVARAEAERRVLAAVMALEEPFRTAVLLRFHEGLSPDEIGRRMDVPPGTARSRVHRGLAILRARLSREGGLAPGVAASTGFVGNRVFEGVRGGLVMGKVAKVAAAGLMLLLLAGGVCLALRDEPPTQAEPAAPEASERAVPARARAGTGRRATPEPAAEAAPETPAVPVPPPPPKADAAPAVTRIEPGFVRWLERSAPPPGVRVIESFDDVKIDERSGTARIGEGGGLQPVGWSEWARVPPRGAATWVVRVLDADGRPLAGATVHRIRPDENGTRPDPCSFQWIDEVGSTGADGVLRAERQPEGDFLVAADWNRRMLRPRGLDTSSAVAVRSASGAPVEVEVRLPLQPARAGTVEGTVRDGEGNPVHRATLSCGFQEFTTRRDGKFRFEGLEAGPASIRARAAGFTSGATDVVVTEGAVAAVDLVLNLAVSGPLRVTGRVVDDLGRPVGDAPVFLGGRTRGLSRWTRSAADGTFAIADLPESAAREGVDVMVSPWMAEAAYLPDNRKDVRPPADVALIVERTVLVTIRLRDAATGDPVTLFKGKVVSEREGRAPRPLGSMSMYSETGTYEVQAPRGRLVISLEAKGYRGMEAAADIPDVDGPKEIVMQFEKAP